jgi:PAS domain S-box-containing protein
MPLRSGFDKMVSRLALVFFLLALCIVSAGYLYYDSQKQHREKEVKDELSAIADLKVNQIVNWRNERIADAAGIFTNNFIASRIQLFLKSSEAPELKQELLEWMRLLQETAGYRSILLVDTTGIVRLTTDRGESTTGSHAKNLIEEAIRSKKAILSDFHKVKAVEYPHLDLIAPIILRRGSAAVPVGAILMRIDPHQFLYPLTQSWPTPSKTAETPLFRREGDEIVYLNELRHQQNTALSLRIPLSKARLPAAMAVQGREGVFEGIDYREVPVLAAARPIPQTPWFLIAKMDINEIYGPLRERAWFVSIFVLMLVTAAGLTIGFWWRQQRAEHYRKQYAAEAEHLALTQKYDYLSKYANDGILLINAEGRIIEANDRAISTYGYNREELLRLQLRDIQPAETLSDINDQMKQVKEQNGFVFETVHKRKDGTTLPAEISLRAIDIGGKTFYQSIVRDITDRKQAEKKIHHAVRLYAVLSQINQAIVRSRDRSRLFQNVCRIAVEYGGFRMAWVGLVVPDTKLVKPVAHSGREEGYLDNIRISIGDEPGGRGPTGTAIREGRYFVCNDILSDPSMDAWRAQAEQRGYRSSAAFPIKVGNAVIGAFNLYSPETDFFKDDEIKLLEEVVLDISFALESMDREEQRKQTETSLRRRNAFIEAILSNLPIGLAANNVEDGRVIYMNSKFEEIYGWPKNILVNVEEFFIHVYPDPVYRKEIKEKIMSDIASGDPSRMRWDDVLITAQTGETKFVTAVNIPLFEQGLMISTVLDVTGRKQAERALAESEKRYKHLVESITDYIFTVRIENGRPVATSHGPGCVTVTGYTPEAYDADPYLWYHMVYEDDRRAVMEHAAKIIAGVSAEPLEHRIIHKDGSIRWVRNAPVPRYDKQNILVAYDGLITDITALKQMEIQLRQAQKMEAVGQLAGGVAHDFNNILTAIVGYGNLLLLKLSHDDPLRHHVEQILASAERAAHLTHSLLAFSRKQIVNPVPVDLNEIIRRVGKLLTRLIGEEIELKTRITDAYLTVMADSIQIEQVLMNLCTNARDAMPNGGLLLIETEMVEVGEEFIRIHGYGKPGMYALLTVSDTGVGMDKKTRDRIFDPFFTTKEVGKGTGLGLAMVYGIIKQHNGYINVYSDPGKGTNFKIYLPLSASALEEPAMTTSLVLHRGTETILLAEDDGSVRELTATVLKNFGYTVIEAVDGEDAVEKFMENKDRVNLLIFDVIMPKKNGKEAYNDIQAVSSGVKVLFLSGYTANLIHKKGILENDANFLMKPVLVNILLKKVRELLDEK